MNPARLLEYEGHPAPEAAMDELKQLPGQVQKLTLEVEHIQKDVAEISSNCWGWMTECVPWTNTCAAKSKPAICAWMARSIKVWRSWMPRSIRCTPNWTARSRLCTRSFLPQKSARSACMSRKAPGCCL